MQLHLIINEFEDSSFLHHINFVSYFLLLLFRKKYEKGRS